MSSPFETHPIERPNGYLITTRPIQETGNMILASLERGFNGVAVIAPGRVGKSTMIQFLTQNQSRWMKQSQMAFSIALPELGRNKPGYSLELLALALGASPNGSKAPVERLKRCVSALTARTAKCNVDQIVIFIDNFHRAADRELEYYADVVDAMAAQKQQLFIVRVHQSDTSGVEVRGSAYSVPSHICGRFFLDIHYFEKISGRESIGHALRQYDDGVFSGTTKVPCSSYFAPGAFSQGWRLESELELLIEVLENKRKGAGLPPSLDLPMMTLARIVERLFLDCVRKRPDFRGLNRMDVETAVDSSGYIELELSYAGLPFLPGGL